MRCGRQCEDDDLVRLAERRSIAPSGNGPVLSSVHSIGHWGGFPSGWQACAPELTSVLGVRRAELPVERCPDEGQPAASDNRAAEIDGTER
jgi:hypothetical protein